MSALLEALIVGVLAAGAVATGACVVVVLLRGPSERIVDADDYRP